MLVNLRKPLQCSVIAFSKSDIFKANMANVRVTTISHQRCLFAAFVFQKRTNEFSSSKPMIAREIEYLS